MKNWNAISPTRHPEPCEGSIKVLPGQWILRTAQNDNQRGGFTLVEVLVSLGIFALAAVVLGTAYVNILTNYQAMRVWTTDRDEKAFARATLLAEPDREKAERGGEMALQAGGNLRWSATIEETARADLFQVAMTFEISPPAPAPARREQQVFLLLRPTWSEAATREKLRTAFSEQLAKRKF